MRSHATRPQEREERPVTAPAASGAVAQVVGLQRTAGNRAVVQLVQRKPFAYASESLHYSESRDDNHRLGKEALLKADAKGAISRKIYGKHSSKEHTGKVVTSFKRKNGGYLVVVTYANLSEGELKYDTAFFSKEPAKPGERSSVNYNPPDPIDA